MTKRHMAVAGLLALGILAAILLAGSEREVPVPVSGTAPGFTLPDLAGKDVSLASFRGGRAVLLAFWATWCPHCNAAVPALEALRERGEATGRFALLAVDYMESRGKVESYVRDRNIRYPVVIDGDGRVARSYGVVGIPTYVLVDADGAVAYMAHVLPPDIDALLRRGRGPAARLRGTAPAAGPGSPSTPRSAS